MSKKILWAICPLLFPTLLFAIPQPQREIPYPIEAKSPTEAHPKNLIEIKSDPTVFPKEPILRQQNNQVDVFSKTEPIKIGPLQTIEQTWLTGLSESLLMNHPIDYKSKEDSYYRKIIRLLNPLDDLNVKDLGFFSTHSPQPGTMVMYVGALSETNEQRYTLAFDDNKIIYFDIQKILTPTSRHLSQSPLNLQRKKASLSKQGSVFLSSSLKSEIIKNASNNAGFIEANHISMVNDQIVLDFKEQPERSKELHTAIEVIKKRDTIQAAENQPRVVWRARKTRIHDRH